MTHKTTEKKPGLIDKAREIISPTPTPAQAREKALIAKWGLKKDASVPHRYWINDQFTITINMGDEESVAAADQELAAYFRAPKIERVTPTTSAAHSPYKQRGKKSEGIMGQIDSALDEIRPMAERASKSNKEIIPDFGFDPERASKDLMSTEGVPDYSPRSPPPSSKKPPRKKPPADDFGLNMDQEFP